MLLLGLLTLQVLCFVDCYPNGAPTGACEDMMPRHAGVSPQTSPAPYTILTNTKKYQPGMPVTGKITTVSNKKGVQHLLVICVSFKKSLKNMSEKNYIKKTCLVWVTPVLLCSPAVTIIGPEYRGVLLEARRKGFNDAYGSWKHPPPDTKFLQVLSTSKSRLNKRQWKAGKKISVTENALNQCFITICASSETALDCSICTKDLTITVLL